MITDTLPRADRTPIPDIRDDDGAVDFVRIPRDDAGFSLIETTIAMVIILVGLLAVADTFTFAIVRNAGNASRTQCLAILQQETESLRSKKFSPNTTDVELTGGTKAVRRVTAPNGGNFSILAVVDDDPFTGGVQVDANSPLKEITVTVKLEGPSPGWQSAIPATIVMRRTRGN